MERSGFEVKLQAVVASHTTYFMLSDQPDVKVLKNPLKSQFPVAGRPGLLFVLLVWKRNAKQLLLRLFVSKQTKDNKKPKLKQKTPSPPPPATTSNQPWLM